MEACAGRDFLALRDKVLILLFIDTGARVSEIAKLDLDLVLLVSRLMKVTGKGNKERLVGYSPDAALALARYVKARKKLAAERGAASSRLWLGQWGKAALRARRPDGATSPRGTGRGGPSTRSSVSAYVCA